MDILTHAALGASLAAALSPSRQRRLAALVGAAAGLLPDADVLIQSGSDPLLVLDFHRHFTHALAFIPLGALLAALILWPFVRRHLSAGRLYLLALVGFAPQGLMDACTSYGTHLGWPFTAEKTAWNLISVFDPVFTLLLVVPLALTLRQPDAARVRIGLALAASYLMLGFVQQARVSESMQAVIAQRGHTPTMVVVKPTLANQLLWRSLYIHDGQIHADATHAGLHLRHYPGEVQPLLGSVPPALAAHAHDIERFRVFSDGWLVHTRPGFIGDARYAMLPTSIAPIWGLRWAEDGATQFVSEHRMTPDERRRWLDMLLGRPASY